MEMAKKREILIDKYWWLGLHWSEYGAELLGTAFLLFVGLSALAFDLSAGSPLARVLPDKSIRWLITGLLFAGSRSLMTILPPGKLSGGHINPAISLAFWLHGKMHRHDVVGYIAGQLLGATLGAGLAVLLWRGQIAGVQNGLTIPGARYPLWSVFLSEMGLTSLFILAIFLFVSSRHLMCWTPLMTWLLMTLIIWLVVPSIGISTNPARSFGPALISWFWQNQWVYYLAPALGAILAVGCFRLLTALGLHDVLTAKLFHAPHYRSIFKNCSAPVTAPARWPRLHL